MPKARRADPPVQMPLRIPPVLKAKLEVMAVLEDTSLNRLCVKILDDATAQKRSAP